MLSILICTYATTLVQAADNDLFTYDTDKINRELKQLQLIEAYVKANPGVTLSGLQAGNNNLLFGLDLNDNNLSGFDNEIERPPLGIPSFIWGFCAGVWGVFIIHMFMQNREQTEKALRGLIIGRVVLASIYITGYLIAIISSA